jgi:peroxiredoxin
MKYFGLLTTLIVLVFNLSAQECTIYGNAGTYSGDKLKLYKYSDYYSKTKIVISECTVDTAGYFTFTVKSDKVFEAILDLDVFLGRIMIEPGKKIKIILPQKQVRNAADEMNPFFKPMEFFVKTPESTDNITAAISAFEKLYDLSFEKIFKDPKHINSGQVEMEISDIDEKTSYCTDSFFIEYKKYRFLNLRQLSYYKNKPAVLQKNFSKEKVQYMNPAYNDLLNETFGSYIFEAKADSIYKYLQNKKNWVSLNSLLSMNEMYYAKDFREYLLAINLCNLFYRQAIYQNDILQIFKNAIDTDIHPITRALITNFLKKSGITVIGNQAPGFVLYNQDKEQISLADFRGWFVYLCFSNLESYACQKDLPLIKDLYKKNIDGLKIITLFKDDNHQRIIDYAVKNEYEWPVLHCYGSDRVLQDYKVAAYPSYFLIHPDGTLVLMPAPGPAEDFEAAYFKHYQEWKRQQIREGNE